MRKIVTIKFGSHLYGTSTPQSDVDLKSVFIPDARSILLQRVKDITTNQRPKALGEKNYAGEVDEETISVQRYLELLAEGQTMALDMLFAPRWSMPEEPSPVWREIVHNRDRVLTRRSAAFLGYARQQAAKYGIKGSRVAAARAALALLTAALSSTEKLSTIDTEIRGLVDKHEHMSIEIDTSPHGQKFMMWEVCNRKLPYSASIKNAWEIMNRLVDEYGKRALMAESQQGVDWKALSHAVRVGHEAIELLETGFITFPLPNAAHVLAIKQGNLLYQDVAAEIESLLDRVEAAAEVSALPEAPDQDWIDGFVEAVYRKEVLTDA